MLFFSLSFLSTTQINNKKKMGVDFSIQHMLDEFKSIFLCVCVCVCFAGGVSFFSLQVVDSTKLAPNVK